MSDFHTPVLLKEVIENLITKKNGIYVDGTLGFGGHTYEILNNLDNNGRVIGIDCDITAINECKKKFKNESRLTIIHGYYNMIDYILFENGIEKVNGILLDIGISSLHIDKAYRGFSFNKEAKLDMRMDTSNKLTAYKIINFWPINKLEYIFKEYGEEKKYKLITKKILEFRKKNIKIETTIQLANIIESVYKGKRKKIHPATKIFQALRIAVNKELENLKMFLDKSLRLLKPGGRLIVISYHSLEDRIVKKFIKYNSSGCICPPQFPVCKCGGIKKLKKITKKPIIPSREEIFRNPRARSAKMRVAEFLGN